MTGVNTLAGAAAVSRRFRSLGPIKIGLKKRDRRGQFVGFAERCDRSGAIVLSKPDRADGIPWVGTLGSECNGTLA